MVVTVTIGNSDDGLSQYRWSAFIRELGMTIASKADTIDFAGFPPADKPWQNACWVFEINQQRCDELRVALAGLAKDYEQDAITWIQSPDVEFIKPDRK